MSWNSVLFAIAMMFISALASAAPFQRSITITGSSSIAATFSDWSMANNSTTATVTHDCGTSTDVTNTAR